MPDSEPVEFSFITMEEVGSMCRTLADMARERGLLPDLVIGIANGGSVPGYFVAKALERPLHIALVQRRGSAIKQRLRPIIDFFHIPSSWILMPWTRWLWGKFQQRTADLVENASTFDFDVKDKDVLVVDDCVETGRTIRYIKDRLANSGAKSITVVAICCVDGIERPDPSVEPDLVLTRIFQFFPWSNNSPYYNDYTAFLKANDIQIYK